MLATNQALTLELKQVYVLGIPVTALLRPQVIARETGREEMFHFFIRTTLPFLGLLITYEGSLVVV